MQFIDEAKINIQAGKGGAGSKSFRREKFVPRGGPDGGDGGRGGSVIFKCTRDSNTLIDFRFQQHFKAQNGAGGMGSNKNGAAGKDLILRVPIGTEIINEENGDVICDLMEDGAEFIAAKGGRGGLGNVNFKSSTNQAPQYAQPGEAGEEFWVRLQLKLLSDAGLLGMPNAGKSTFLSATTRAKPKIADYPFTTLKPQLGVVYVDENEFVLADIPGLIAGASQGKGLGDRFLKHVERCAVLLHLIDVSSENICENYQTIRDELEGYSPELLVKPEVIALSKIDLLDKEEMKEKLTEFKKFLKKTKKKSPKIFTISAATNQGLKEVLREIYAEIQSFRKLENEEENQE
jgi:GTP-binding protein